MRALRSWQTEDGVRWFHCISRVVNKEFVFGDEEREMFRRMMRKIEAFSGVEVVTWAILSNHFHLLLHVPDRPETMSDKELLGRLGKIYPRVHVNEVRQELKRLSKAGREEAKEQLRERYLRRMFDLSAFMKGLKQRFTMWFNHRRGRTGTLWPVAPSRDP